MKIKRIKSFGICVILAFLVYISVYLFVKDPWIIKLFNNIALVVVSLVASILSYFSAKIFGWKIREGKIFYILFVAIFLYFLGELTWCVYEVFLGIEVPYPSIADLFWICGIFTFIIAIYMKLFSISVGKGLSKIKILMLLLLSSIRKDVPKLRILMIIFFFIIASSFSSHYVLIPILAKPETEFEGGLIEKFTDLIYPISEMILLIGVVMIFIVHKRIILTLTWILIMFYLILNFVFDTLFSYLNSYELYYTGHPIDILYFSGYLLLIIALRNQLSNSNIKVNSNKKD